MDRGRGTRSDRAVTLAMVVLLFLLPSTAGSLSSTGSRAPGIPLGTSFSWDGDGDRIDDRVWALPAGRTRFLLWFESNHGAPLVDGVPGVRQLAVFRILPLLWVEAPVSAAPTLAALRGVRYVEWDAPLRPTLDDGALAIKARDDPATAYSGAWRTDGPHPHGPIGSDVTIAVLEGGIDRRHEALDDQPYNATAPSAPKVRAVLHAWYRYLWTTGEDPLYVAEGPTPPAAPSGPCTAVAGICPSGPGPISDLEAAGGTDLPLEETAVPHIHATAMGGLAAGTRPAASTAAADGAAPGASLVDVVAYAPDGGAAWGIGVGAAVSGVDLVHEFNLRNPQAPIDILLVPLTPESDAVPSNADPGGQDALAAALDALATHHPTKNPHPVLPVVSGGKGHVDGNGHTTLVGPATASRALVVGPSDGRGTPCRGDDVPVTGSDRASAAQRARGLQKPDLLAPGVNLSAPLANTRDVSFAATGSSAAAALASGVAALAFEELRRELSTRPLPAQVHARLLSSAEARGAFDGVWGHGLLDAARAVDASTLLGERIATRVELDSPVGPLAITKGSTVKGRVVVADLTASTFVAERAPENRCMSGPAGPDTVAPRTYVNGDSLSGVVVHLGLDAPPPGPDEALANGTTDPDGRFEIPVTVDADVPLGPHALHAVASELVGTHERHGSLGHAASVDATVIDTAVIDLDACHPFRPPVCTPSRPIVDATEDAMNRTARLRLSTAAGFLIDDAVLTMTWQGPDGPALAIVALDENGVGYAEYSPAGPAGPRALTAAFAGTPGVAANSTERVVIVRHPTVLDLRMEEAPDSTDGVVRFEGRLFDPLANVSLPGRRIDLVVSASSERSIANTTTDENGEYEFELGPAELAAGRALYRASWAGEEAYAASQSPPQALAVARDLALSVHAATALRGENATVRGRLMHAQGGADGFPVTVDVLGRQITRAFGTTASDGTFEVLVPVAASETLGRLAIQVRYPGDAINDPIEVEGTLDLLAMPALIVDPGVALRGANTTVTGRLLDDAGQPLHGRSVRLTMGGRLLGNATSDAAGRFRLEVPIPAAQAVGPVAVRARVEAKHPFAAAEAVRTHSVQALARVEIANASIVGSSLVVGGRATDERGRPLTGNVTLHVDDAVGPVGSLALVAPAELDLRRAKFPFLIVNHAHELGEGPRPDDFARVDVSTDDGQTWRGIEPITDGAAARTSGTGDAVLAGASRGWAPVTLGLNGVSGSDVVLRWRYESAKNQSAAMWAIDDVELLAANGTSLYHSGFGPFASGTVNPGWAAVRSAGSLPLESGPLVHDHPRLAPLLAAGDVMAVTPAADANATKWTVTSPVLSGAPGNEMFLLFHAWLDLGAQGRLRMEITRDGGATWNPLAFEGVSLDPSGGRQEVWTPYLANLTGVTGPFGVRWVYESTALPAARPAAADQTPDVVRALEWKGDRAAYGTAVARATLRNPSTSTSRVDLRFVVTGPDGAEVVREERPVDVEPGTWQVDLPWRPLVPGLHRVRVERVTGDALEIAGEVAGIGWFVDDVRLLAFRPQRTFDVSTWELDGFRVDGATIRSLPPTGESRLDVATGPAVTFEAGEVLLLGHANDFATAPDPQVGRVALRNGTTTEPAAPFGAPMGARPDHRGRVPVHLSVHAVSPGRWQPELRHTVPATATSEQTWQVIQVRSGVLETLHHEAFDGPIPEIPVGNAWTALNGTWRVVAAPADPASNRTDGPVAELDALRAGRSAALVSPRLQIPAGATVRFWHEADLPSSTRGFVEASPDGGRTWTRLEAIVEGETAGFAVDVFDLAPAAGGKARVRLTLQVSDSGEDSSWSLARVGVVEMFPIPRILFQASAADLAAWPQVQSGDESITTSLGGAPVGVAPAPRTFTLLARDKEELAANATLVGGQFLLRAPLSQEGLESVPFAVRVGGIPDRLQAGHASAEAGRVRIPTLAGLTLANGANPESHLVAGADNVLHGRLLDERGRPIANATVLVLLEDEPYADTKTHVNGTFAAAFDIALHERRGNRTLVVEVPADPLVGLSTTRKEIHTTLRALSRLDVHWDRPAPGRLFTVGGRLWDPEGRPLPGAAVLVQGGEQSAYARTDAEGKFGWDLMAPAAGSLHVAVAFPGTEEIASSSFAADIIVQPRSGLSRTAWLLAAAAFVVCGAAVFLWRRRKGVVEPVATDAPAYDLDLSDPTRAAVLAAYGAAVRLIGVHTPASTARELFAHAPAGIDRTALAHLIRLFERARYGADPLPASASATAAELLERLRPAQEARE